MGWDAPCFPPSVFEATRRAPEKAVEGFNTIVRAPAAGELGRWRGGDGAPSHEGLCLCSPRACPRFSGRHVAWNRAWDASGRAGGPPAAQQARHPLVAPCSCATALPGPLSSPALHRPVAGADRTRLQPSPPPHTHPQLLNKQVPLHLIHACRRLAGTRAAQHPSQAITLCSQSRLGRHGCRRACGRRDGARHGAGKRVLLEALGAVQALRSRSADP